MNGKFKLKLLPLRKRPEEVNKWWEGEFPCVISKELGLKIRRVAESFPSLHLT